MSRVLERLLAQGRQEKLWDRQLSLLAGFLQYQQDTFKSQCKAKSLRRRATQSFCQPVISSAPDQRVLGSQRSTRDFKRGPRVVVQAAYQARHNGEGDLPARQIPQEPVEVGAAGVVQKVRDLRQRLDDGLARFHFAIEHTQRVGFTAPLTVGAEL